MLSLTTLGYSHKDAQATIDNHIALGGYIADIRLSPETKVPGFNGRELGAKYKGRYGHISELGNLNHHTGRDIVLKSTEPGLARLDTAFAKGPVMLLCGCKWVETCHRLYVTQLAQARHPGLEPVHLLQADHKGMITHARAIPTGKCAYVTSGVLCPYDADYHCPRCTRPICCIHEQSVQGLFVDRVQHFCPPCYDAYLNEQSSY